MIIDSHQHFWKLDRGDYSWLTIEQGILYKDYLPQDLHDSLESNDITGTIAVQAAPSLAETYYLLDLANHYSKILGVVGWVDFDSESSLTDLSQLVKYPKFLGVRPMLQDIQQVDWILKAEYREFLEQLSNYNLTFDALIFPKHLEIIDRLAYEHPNLKIIIDHMAKPNLDDKTQFNSWANQLTKLSKHKNIYCKYSGLLTQSEKQVSEDELQPYVDVILNTFTSKRLIWGSDWPVVTLKDSYTGWYKLSNRLLLKCGCNDAAIADIMANNAISFYNIKNISLL